jgi:hypothetical protein
MAESKSVGLIAQSSWIGNVEPADRWQRARLIDSPDWPLSISHGPFWIFEWSLLNFGQSFFRVSVYRPFRRICLHFRCGETNSSLSERRVGSHRNRVWGDRGGNCAGNPPRHYGLRQSPQIHVSTALDRAQIAVLTCSIRTSAILSRGFTTILCYGFAGRSKGLRTVFGYDQAAPGLSKRRVGSDCR